MTRVTLENYFHSRDDHCFVYARTGFSLAKRRPKVGPNHLLAVIRRVKSHVQIGLKSPRVVFDHVLGNLKLKSDLRLVYSI